MARCAKIKHRSIHLLVFLLDMYETFVTWFTYFSRGGAIISRMEVECEQKNVCTVIATFCKVQQK